MGRQCEGHSKGEWGQQWTVWSNMARPGPWNRSAPAHGNDRAIAGMACVLLLKQQNSAARNAGAAQHTAKRSW